MCDKYIKISRYILKISTDVGEGKIFVCNAKFANYFIII